MPAHWWLASGRLHVTAGKATLTAYHTYLSRNKWTKIHEYVPGAFRPIRNSSKIEYTVLGR